MDLVSGLLTSGKNARLYKRLVYELQIAQDVNAFQQSQSLGSVFLIVATARPRPEPREDSADHRRRAGQAARDTARRSRNAAHPQPGRGQLLWTDGARRRFRREGRSAERLLRADGHADFFEEDLARCRHWVPPTSAPLARFLPKDRRVELSILPEGK